MMMEDFLPLWIGAHVGLLLAAVARQILARVIGQ